MKKELDREIIFSKEELLDALKIWEKCSISLIDIRHSLISREDAINNYIMPANTFIYTNGGKAEVYIGDNSYNVDNFGVFHGGKGAEISIRPIESWIETYMILYKASEPSLYRRDFHRLIENMNPFSLQYGFQPSNPLFFGSKFLEMYEKWQKPTPLNLFYEKAAFYQMVYAVYEELVNESISIFSLDVISMAKRYIDGHYSEAISIQNIAYMLGISDSNLRRNFKKRYGKSPQEYLTKYRLEQAKKLLNTKNISVKSVAVSCGFQDEFNFSKLFLKNAGMSPTQYRAKTPVNISDYTMESDFLFPYNKERLVRVIKLFEEGEYKMLKQLKNKTVIAAVLSLTLLLTACSSVANSNGDGAKSNNEASQSVDTGTRIIKTDLEEVEIPVNPKRIVGIGCMLNLVALNANYINMDDHEKLTYFNETYNWEELMSLEPDLIIAENFDGADEYIERCKQIAPTITFESYGDPKAKHLFIGDATGNIEKAEKQVADYDKTLANSKKQLEDKGIYRKKVAILQYAANGVMYSYGDKLGRGGDLIFNTLDFKATDLIQKQVLDGKEYYLQLSMETLPQYVDADYIVVMQANSDTKSLYDNEVWKSIEAVRAGKYFSISQEEYKKYFNSPSIVELQGQIELITKYFLDTAK
jgi:iron complex transport system substrate-binding protein